jgi:hypothetical protein
MLNVKTKYLLTASLQHQEILMFSYKLEKFFTLSYKIKKSLFFLTKPWKLYVSLQNQKIFVFSYKIKEPFWFCIKTR